MKLERTIITNWDPRFATIEELAPDVNLHVEVNEGVEVPEEGVQIYGLRMMDLNDGSSTIYVLTEADRQALVEKLTGVLPVQSTIELPKGAVLG